MNFVHVSLVAGMALATIPIMLHLLGRREPKRVNFPALRFVRETAVKSQRGWSIRRWLLLALRILLVMLLALAFASPRVHSAMLATYLSLGLVALLAFIATAAAAVSFASRHPFLVRSGIATLATILWAIVGVWAFFTATQGAAAPTQAAVGPICAAIVIDTSPSMEYKFANKTRLEEAKETARWLMDRLPVDSQIAIVSANQGQRLHQGRVSANRQLDNVKSDGRLADLSGRVRTAIELVRSSKLNRREVYVLTDMMANSWRDAASAGIPNILKTGEPVLLQLIDVGASKRENWSIKKVQLSQEVVTPGSSVNISANIVASDAAPATQVAVELLVEERDPALPAIRNGSLAVPKAVVKERQTVDVAPGGTAKFQFALRDIASGTTNALLRLSRPDPLTIDNEVNFTVEARPQGKLLVLGNQPEGGEMDIAARLAALALDPELKQVDLVPFSRIPTIDFAKYASAVLVDPVAMDDSMVVALERSIEVGMGLLIVMGPAIDDAKTWKSGAIQRLIPGEVSLQWRRPLSDSSIYFSTVRPDHPLWGIFDSAANDIPWSRYPVHKYWAIDPLASDATVVVRYSSSGHPAVIEQNRGAGSILTITTPITQPESINPAPWNRLFASPEPWPAFGLLSGAVGYLSGSSHSRRNMIAGTSATIDNSPDLYPVRYELFTPVGDLVRVQALSNSVNYAFTNDLGFYRLRGLQADKPALRGFSVQMDDNTINLVKATPEVMDAALGKDQYFLVQDRDGLQSSLGQARFGRDLSPFLLAIIVLIVIAEQAMSYRFYSLGVPARRS